jgi:hypothetical protein
MEKEIIDLYKVYPEQRFILQRLLGVVNFENLVKVKADQDQDPSFDANFSLLTDVRDAEVQFSAEEIHQYIQYLKSEFKEGENRRIALVTATPLAVAVGTMVQSGTAEMSDELRIFSTPSVALDWLNVNIPKEELIEFFEGNYY